MPSTEAGKRLLDDEMHQRLLLAIGEKADTTEEDIAADIDAIEAEAREQALLAHADEDAETIEAVRANAVAAERARLAEAVRGLPQPREMGVEFNRGYASALRAVLALLEPEA